MKKGDTIQFDRTKCFITEVLATSQGEDIVWIDYTVSGQQQAISMELAERTCTRRVLIEKEERIFEFSLHLIRQDNRIGILQNHFYLDGQNYLF